MANLIALTVRFAFRAASSHAVPFQTMSSRAAFNLPLTPPLTVFPMAARCWVVSSVDGLSGSVMGLCPIESVPSYAKQSVALAAMRAVSVAARERKGVWGVAARGVGGLAACWRG
jgi:hypothetical protein